MTNLPSIYISRILLLDFGTLSSSTTTGSTYTLINLVISSLLPLLFLPIWDPSCFLLAVLDLTEVDPNGSAAEGVSLRRATVLLVGGTEASDECIEASPGLPERAGTGCRWGWLSKEDATVQVNLGLPKLVKVTQEFQNMVEVAL